MAKFSIDGRDFVGGRSVIIRNGVVTIDGVEVGGKLNGVVEIRVTEGQIGNLRCDSPIVCGDVAGNVDAGMDVTCGSVGGNVDAGMNVNCGEVHGDIDAGMGVKTVRR